MTCIKKPTFRSSMLYPSSALKSFSETLLQRFGPVAGHTESLALQGRLRSPLSAFMAWRLYFYLLWFCSETQSMQTEYLTWLFRSEVEPAFFSTYKIISKQKHIYRGFCFFRCTIHTCHDGLEPPMVSVTNAIHYGGFCWHQHNWYVLYITSYWPIFNFNPTRLTHVKPSLKFDYCFETRFSWVPMQFTLALIGTNMRYWSRTVQSSSNIPRI